MQSSIHLNITNFIFQFHSKLSYFYLKYLFNTSGATSSSFLSVYKFSPSLTFPLRHFFSSYSLISFIAPLSFIFSKNSCNKLYSTYNCLSFPHFEISSLLNPKTTKYFYSPLSHFFSLLSSLPPCSISKILYLTSLFKT